MKKIKLWAPVLGLSAVATSAIGITSCNTYTFDPTIPFYFKTDHENRALRSSQVSLDGDKEYKVNIDASLLPPIPTDPSEINDKHEGRFFIGKNNDTPNAKIISATIFVDKVQLTEVYDYDELKEANKFYIESREACAEASKIFFSDGTITDSSKIEINFEIQETVKDYYMIFYIFDV